MPTPDKYKPVPIGLGSLPGAPTLGDDTSDDPVVAPPIDPVEGAQPEEMRFTAGEYADFSRAFSKANLGNDVYQLSDFFRRDPESDDENPMYLYTGTPINFYGGYGEDKDGRSVKITRGNSVFTGGSRKGQTVDKAFVVNNFLRELAAIDESPE